MGLLDDTFRWSGQVYGEPGWLESQGGTAVTVDKATGDKLGEVGWAAAADAQRAAVAAAERFPSWRTTTPDSRRDVLIRAAQLLQDNADELASWLIRETGGIRKKAGFELGKARAELLEAAALPSQPTGHLLASADGVRSIARRVPRGPVIVITPWNFPLVLGLRFVAPALATGNTVILKPDPNTPVTGGVVIARLFEEAGLPPGVLQVLPGAAPAGEALVTAPQTRLVAFTGSTGVGRRVAELAAPLLKKVILELGGNNAYVVLDDADLAAAASSGAYASFMHQGQVCMTAGRHVVQASIAGDYVRLLAQRADALSIGDPARENVHVGPMINHGQLAKVDRIVSKTIAAGAALVTGGTHEGPYYRPTVLDQVAVDTEAFQQEIFGPVAPVTVVSSDEEAIAVANASEYGLTAAVQSADLGRAEYVADRLSAGTVHINDQTVEYQPHAPFGGMNASGNGSRFGGPASLDELTEWQWMTSRAVPAAHPF